MKIRIPALVLFSLLALTACTLERQPPGTPPPAQSGDVSSPAGATATGPLAATQTQPVPTPSEALGAAMLTLDRDYFCNHGPGRNYTDIVDFPAGTVLPIISTDGTGWWLVRIDDPRTHHTECWIGGGIPSGDTYALPTPQPGGPYVPAHDPLDWENVIYLTCSELDSNDWTWNGSGSGEYSALEPILGISRATIVYTEYTPLCPGAVLHLHVPIHNKDTGATIGYMTCPDFASTSWYWGIPGGGWISSASLFGSNRATFVQIELNMNCPSATSTKVVPVHGASWEIIGFLGCSEMGSYTWSMGAGSGEYVAASTLFGSDQAQITYSEYNPACPSFSP